MRYFRLLKAFYKNALLAELEYRANFVVNMLTNVFWLFWAIVGLQVFFSQRSTLGGWTYDEALVVVGVFNLAAGFNQAFLVPNIQEISNHIRLGTMDFILTKPVNSQFLASMRTMSVWRLSDMALGIVVIVIAAARTHADLTWLAVGTFLVMLVAGAIMLYTISLMLVTTAFWFVRIDNIIEVFNAFYEAGRFPITVYRGAVRVLLTFIVPIAFITTVPAAVLVNKLEPNYAFYSVALAAGLFLLSAWFWKFALRFYASASS